MIYTAVTRAKRKVILVGQRKHWQSLLKPMEISAIQC
ncbi:MAG: hypothetical protein ACLTB5_03375 [Acutalibacteraceae bacterium]